MVITANRVEVLTALRANRESHAKIVAEARAGYLERATAALTARLEKLRAGKLISTGMAINLPQDYTNVYDTAIKMLELHQGDTVVLNAQQVRNLVRDDWDWTSLFLTTNSAYSGTARAVGGSNEGDE